MTHWLIIFILVKLYRLFRTGQINLETMNFNESSHKKILGILFIAFSALGLLGLVFYDFFMDFVNVPKTLLN